MSRHLVIEVDVITQNRRCGRSGQCKCLRTGQRLTSPTLVAQFPHTGQLLPQGITLTVKTLRSLLNAHMLPQNTCFRTAFDLMHMILQDGQQSDILTII